MSLPPLRWKASTPPARAAAVAAADWEMHKEQLCQLYGTTKLEDLMVSMKNEHNFTPSRRQYVLQFQKWNLRKYRNGKEKADSENMSISNESETPTVDWSHKSPRDSRETTIQASSAFSPLRRLGGLVRVPTIREKRRIEGEPPNASSKRLKSYSLTPGIGPSADFGRNVFGANSETVDSLMQEQLDQDGQDICPILSSDMELADDIGLVMPGDQDLGYGTIIDDLLGDHAVHAGLMTSNSVPEARNVDAEAESPSAGSLRGSATDLSDTDLRHELLAALLYLNYRQCFEHLSIEDEKVFAVKSGEILKLSSLAKLLRFAEAGECPTVSNYEHIQVMRSAADFFFGAQSFEDAFVLYLLIYKSLKTLSDVSRVDVFSALINLARSSANATQDQIAKDLLLKALRKSHRGRVQDKQEMLLLHGLLTVIYQRQADFIKADHHCHHAIQGFRSQGRIITLGDCRALCLTVYSRLGTSLTTKLLTLFNRELEVEVRQRVLSRASDQLIRIASLEPTTGIQTASIGSLYSITEEEETAPHAENTQKNFILRLLLRWCANALRRTNADRRGLRTWRTPKGAGIGIRSFDIAALYCHLWQQWQHEEKKADACGSYAESWAKDIKNILAIDPHECLATVPTMIVLAWPFEKPFIVPMNWRSHTVGLHRRALVAIDDILHKSDLAVAHLFFEAYDDHSISCSAKMKSVPSAYRALLKDSIREFAARNLSIELPGLESDEVTNPLGSSGNEGCNLVSSGAAGEQDFEDGNTNLIGPSDVDARPAINLPPCATEGERRPPHGALVPPNLEADFGMIEGANMMLSADTPGKSTDHSFDQFVEPNFRLLADLNLATHSDTNNQRVGHSSALPFVPATTSAPQNPAAFADSTHSLSRYMAIDNELPAPNTSRSVATDILMSGGADGQPIASDMASMATDSGLEGSAGVSFQRASSLARTQTLEKNWNIPPIPEHNAEHEWQDDPLALHPSRHSSSSGLASMTSLSQRIRRDASNRSRLGRIIDAPPSSAIQNVYDIVLSLEPPPLSGAEVMHNNRSDIDFGTQDRVLGLAQRSLESLSLSSGSLSTRFPGYGREVTQPPLSRSSSVAMQAEV